MATKYIIYTAGLTLYSKTVEDSTPWATDVQTITEDVSYPGVYPVDTDHPFLYVQAGVSPADSDTKLGDVREFYYGTVADGDLYHATRFHAWDWENATLEDKVKALYTSTRAIDKFNFIGEKVVETQGLEFPRTRTLSDGTVCEIGGTDGVPTSIENAAYLISDALVGGRDPQADFEAQNVKVETFGPVRTEFATDKGPMQHTANLIPSPSAWALILPFLGISTAFSVNKG
jgi:hypothetical protein